MFAHDRIMLPNQLAPKSHAVPPRLPPNMQLTLSSCHRPSQPAEPTKAVQRQSIAVRGPGRPAPVVLRLLRRLTACTSIGLLYHYRQHASAYLYCIAHLFWGQLTDALEDNHL